MSKTKTPNVAQKIADLTFDMNVWGRKVTDQDLAICNPGLMSTLTDLAKRYAIGRMNKNDFIADVIRKGRYSLPVVRGIMNTAPAEVRRESVKEQELVTSPSQWVGGRLEVNLTVTDLSDLSWLQARLCRELLSQGILWTQIGLPVLQGRRRTVTEVPNVFYIPTPANPVCDFCLCPEPTCYFQRLEYGDEVHSVGQTHLIDQDGIWASCDLCREAAQQGMEALVERAFSLAPWPVVRENLERLYTKILPTLDVMNPHPIGELV